MAAQYVPLPDDPLHQGSPSIARAYPPRPHIDQRPRKDPNHVIEKSVSRNMEFQQIFFLQKFQPVDRPDGRLPRRAAGGFKGFEVVSPCNGALQPDA